MAKKFKNPLVSVVIPAFNEEEYIEKTLESLAEQTFNDFEVLVVDNNSTDNTAKVAENFGAKVFLEARQGVAFARQKGFLKARGKIIVSTDADTIFPKNWLSLIAAEFKKDEKLAAVGGIYSLCSGSAMAKFFFRHFFHFFLRADKFFSGAWSLVGANFAVRKKIFLSIGGFNTKLTLDEDVELCHRVGKIGKVSLNPKIIVQTSGRRYRNGLFLGLMDYLPHIISRIILKRYDKFIKLSPVRVENPSVNKAVGLAAVALFFVLFSFWNPKIVRAKNIDLLRKKMTALTAQKIALTKQTIQNNREAFKDFINSD